MSPCLALLMAFTKHIPWIPAARSAPGQPQEDTERRESALSLSVIAPYRADLLLGARSSFIRPSPSAKISPDTNLWLGKGEGTETPKPHGAHPQPALAEEREHPA